MLEPRYPPTAAAAPRMLEPTAPHDLDAAVDLSRKSANEAKAAAAAAMAAAAAAAAAANAEAARAREDSDDDAPLDLKVRHRPLWRKIIHCMFWAKSISSSYSAARL